MPSNIEIKAKARNFERQKQLAEKLSDSPPQKIDQEDTFFCTPKGRLKLRVSSPCRENRRGELIYYEREDTAGPKSSNYLVSTTIDPASLNSLLTSALGLCGIVRKSRNLYRVGQTRIHCDVVENLGEFLELEVVMQPNQSVDEGIAIAKDLMNRLEITEQDLIQGAYLDLLTA